MAIRESEDTRELSRRDLTELMERLHAIPSAVDFRGFVMIRNRLAHLYPEDPERQAANLNAAYDAAPRLLEAASPGCPPGDASTEPVAVIATKERRSVEASRRSAARRSTLMCSVGTKLTVAP